MMICYAQAPDENPNSTATVITLPADVAPKRANMRTAEVRMADRSML